MNRFRMMKNNKAARPSTYFFSVSLFGIAAFILAAPFVGIKIFDWIAMEGNSFYYGVDHYQNMLYSITLPHVYDVWQYAVYSPLLYCFYYLMLRSTVDFSALSENDLTVRGIENLPYQDVLKTMLCVCGIALFIFAVYQTEIKKHKKEMLCFSYILSAPVFMGAIERGNNILLCVPMLILFLVWIDSDSRIKRELALLLLAFSSSIKIYTVVMAVVLLKEKRWKDIGRLCIYEIAGIVVPFALCGGNEAVKAYISNLNFLRMTVSSDRIEYFSGLMILLGIKSEAADILALLFAGILILLSILTRSSVRQHIYISAVMAMYPQGAYRYTLTYFIIPLIVMLMNENNAKTFTAEDYIYSVLFGGIFTIPVWTGLINDFKVYAYNTEYTHLTMVEVSLYSCAWVLLIYAVFYELYSRLKRFRKVAEK